MMFQHTFATTLLTKGAPIEDIAFLIGHSTPLIAAEYYSHSVNLDRVGWKSACAKSGHSDPKAISR